jgi:hypothetical protein
MVNYPLGKHNSFGHGFHWVWVSSEPFFLVPVIWEKNNSVWGNKKKITQNVKRMTIMMGFIIQSLTAPASSWTDMRKKRFWSLISTISHTQGCKQTRPVKSLGKGEDSISKEK